MDESDEINSKESEPKGKTTFVKVVVTDASTILSMAKRRGILWPAFEIYGGMAGFYDYGPLGATLRENIISLWREHFVFGERCAEIVTPDITPEEVFKASGHVGEFKDFMVKCMKCHAAFRADHLLQHLEINADNLTADELTEELIKNNISCPDCKGALGAPEQVMLMFETKIGLGNPRQGYLRPETAQGMFVNFQSLYRFFRDRLPFGAAQIGRGFRNEISPRQGIVRLREMTMAELEYFFNPNEEKFPQVSSFHKDQVILVPSLDPNDEVKITIAEALEKGIIKSEIMAYFMGLTQRFLVKVGLDPTRLRFRKHQQNEMAHYATECWDAEAHTSFSWLEIVGIANRSAFDLTSHIDATGAELTAYIPYDEPIERDIEILNVNMQALGPLFKGDAGKIKAALEALPIDQLKDKETVKVTINNEAFEVPAKCFNIEQKHEKVSGERIIPNVIEPSFGIDRIFYTLLEHSYHEVEAPAESDEAEAGAEVNEEAKDEMLKVLSFKPWVAPVHVGVFPLMPKDGLVEIAEKVNEILREGKIQTYYDTSGSIGRRYARMDEIGTPFCITVDYESKDDCAMTIRDRDTHHQVRVRIGNLTEVIQKLISGKSDFEDFR